MYKSRRRPWVKLYCREWLTSTVRLTLTEEDRSRFIDLLAMAGDSKVPGVVCAGQDQSKVLGYPLDWLANMMRCSVSQLRTSLAKFERQNRVTLAGKDRDHPVIKITGWNKYQSEYLRQIEAVKKRKSPRTSPQFVEQSLLTSPQLLKTEVEVEVEVEGEGEGEVDKRKREKKETPPAVLLPDWVPLETWKDFLELRKKIRAPMTQASIRLAIRTLEKLRAKGEDVKAVLEQSIERGWRGLFSTSKESKDEIGPGGIGNW